MRDLLPLRSVVELQGPFTDCVREQIASFQIVKSLSKWHSISIQDSRCISKDPYRVLPRTLAELLSQLRHELPGISLYELDVVWLNCSTMKGIVAKM